MADQDIDRTPIAGDHGRTVIAQRLTDAGIDCTTRFVNVVAGGKASYSAHTDATNRYAPGDTALTGNYGIYATPTDALVILDVDDYTDLGDTRGVEAIDGLPSTLQQQTAHDGTHRFYAVAPDEKGRPIADVLAEEFGTANPHPSWGEVRAANQFVVGAGSELDSCDKDWCDACATPAGGHYSFGADDEGDRPIATLTPDDLLAVLRADPNLTTDAHDADDAGQSVSPDVPRTDTRTATDPDGPAAFSDHDLIAKAKAADNGDYFTDLWEGRWERHTHRWQGDSQSEADAALCSLLAFWTGGDAARIEQLFGQSALARPKWHDRADYREATIQGAIAECDEFYNGPRDSTVDSKAVRDQAAMADPNGVGDANASGATLLVPNLDDDLMVTEDQAGYAVSDGDGPPRPITNFLLAVEHILQTPDDDTVVSLRVIPRDSDPFTVEVAPAVFNELRDFRAAVCTGLATWFDGGRSDLNHLRDLLAQVDVSERIGVTTVGLHGIAADGSASASTARPELVLPEGTLTAEGWADDPTHVYLSNGTDFETKVELSPATHPDANYDRDAVATLLDLLPQTRDPERFIPVLGWMYATTFRPWIRAQTQEFNLLGVTGDTGAGKSGSLSNLLGLFGLERDLFSVDTSFALVKTFATTNALPVLVDEYKPSDIADGRVNTLHNLLRKSTTGAVELRGNTDRTTDRYSITAPVGVAGESAIQGPAERRRTIMTTFRTATTTPQTPTQQAYAALLNHRDAYHDHALAWYRWVLQELATPAEVRERWQQADARVGAILDTRGYTDTALDPLPRQGLQTVIFGVDCYRTFATEMGLSPGADGLARLTDDHVARAVGALADDLVEGDQRKSHLDEFLELCSDAALDGVLVYDEHYTVVHEETADEELRLKPRACFNKVNQYVDTHDLGEAEDVLPGRDDYKQRFRDAADKEESYVTCTSQNTPPLNRATGIHMQRAATHLDGFIPEHFRPSGRGPTAGGSETASSAAHSSDGTMAGATTVPLARAADAAATGSTGVRTLTVRVTDLDIDPHDAIRAAGHFEDDTGALPFVWFESDDHDELLLDQLQQAANATGTDDTPNTLRVEKVRLSTRDGEPQVRLVGGLTDARPIQPGAGSTTNDDG